jgi:hypothetical protein
MFSERVEDMPSGAEVEELSVTTSIHLPKNRMPSIIQLLHRSMAGRWHYKENL